MKADLPREPPWAIGGNGSNRTLFLGCWSGRQREFGNLVGLQLTDVNEPLALARSVMKREKEVVKMMIELGVAERDLLKKILDSYLSELRGAIAATKRETSPLHAEENLVKALQKKVSEVT